MTVEIETFDCSVCKENKPASDFYKMSARKFNGLRPECKVCSAAKTKEYFEKNPECRHYHNLKARLKDKGLTIEEFNQMVEDQGGGCAVCGQPEKASYKSMGDRQSRLSVDHDHKTGLVRGLLCSNCNTALGLLGEDVERMKKLMEYVETWK